MDFQGQEWTDHLIRGFQRLVSRPALAPRLAAASHEVLWDGDAELAGDSAPPRVSPTFRDTE